MHHITYLPTEALIRSAVFAFWRRTVGAGFFVVWGLLCALLVVLVLTGEQGWPLGALGATLVLGACLATAVYWVHLSASLGRLRALTEPACSLRLDEAGLSAQSSLGTTTIPWAGVQEVWCSASFYLVLLSKAQFFTLPLATLDEPARNYFLAQVRDHGGRVVNLR